MLRACLALLAALLLGAAGPPNAPPAPSPPAAALPPATDEARALAAELARATGMEARTAQVMGLMRNSMVELMRTSSHLPAEDVGKIVDEVLLPEMRSRVGELSAAIVEIYATTYSPDELRQLLAFYKSPLGQRLLQLAPRINELTIAAGQAWGRQVGRDAIQNHLEELRRRGITI